MDSIFYLYVRPSRCLRYLILTQVLLVFLVLLGVLIAGQIALAMLVSIFVAFYVRRYVSSRTWHWLHAPFQLQMRRNFTLSLRFDEAGQAGMECREARILKDSQVYDHLVLLSLEFETGARFRFPLPFDTMDADDFRRLKVLVLYSVYHNSLNLAQNQHIK